MSEADKQQAVISSERLGLYREIEAERVVQDHQWGGPVHDDSHSTSDWADVIDQQLLKAIGPQGPLDSLAEINAEDRSLFRRYMIRTAAVAIAAV